MYNNCDRLNLQFSVFREFSDPSVIWYIYAGILNMAMYSPGLMLISLKYQLDISAVLPFVALGNNDKTGLPQLTLHPVPLPLQSLCLRALVSWWRGVFLTIPSLAYAHVDKTLSKIVPSSLHLVSVSQGRLSRCSCQSLVKEPDEDLS